MLFVVFSSINCLPTESLIDGKIIDTRQSSRLAQTNGDSRRAADVSSNQSPPLNTSDPIAIGESRSPTEAHKRVKRVYVFRPLFVYRQEQVKRRRIIEKRKLRSRKLDKDSTIEHHTVKPCKNYSCCDNCRHY